MSHKSGHLNGPRQTDTTSDGAYSLSRMSQGTESKIFPVVKTDICALHNTDSGGYQSLSLPDLSSQQRKISWWCWMQDMRITKLFAVGRNQKTMPECLFMSHSAYVNIACRFLYLLAPQRRTEILLECNPKLFKLLSLCVNCAAVKYNLTLQSVISQHSLWWKEGSNSPKLRQAQPTLGIYSWPRSLLAENYSIYSVSLYID